MNAGRRRGRRPTGQGRAGWRPLGLGPRRRPATPDAAACEGRRAVPSQIDARHFRNIRCDHCEPTHKGQGESPQIRPHRANLRAFARALMSGFTMVATRMTSLKPSKNVQILMEIRYPVAWYLSHCGGKRDFRVVKLGASDT